MLHLIFKKISQYVIVAAFSLFAFGIIFLTIQTQLEQSELTEGLVLQAGGTLKTSQAELSPNKIIHINNFPVKAGYISSPYGMRKDPFTGKRTMHRGLDIAARKGTSIYPIGEGKVIFSGRKSGFGNMIEIQHSSTVVSRYSHLEKSLVKKGQLVKTTDIIGRVGNTGRSTGPHLHLEIAFNGKTANPRVYLSREVASSE